MPLNPDDIDVRPAVAADRRLLTGLLRYYVYDFSEFEDVSSDRLSFDDKGEFRLSINVAPYLNDRDRWAYVIEVRGKPAGFALVNKVSHAHQEIDFNMGEYFVARKYRRHGVATAALHRILAMHPGRWEVAIIEANAGARKFWPRAIAAAPGASALRQATHDSADWNGPIWCFAIERT
jgi:predicted acetyltransferase